MCKVTRIIDGACDHYPRYSLSRSCRYGWSYSDDTCRGNEYDVVSSINLEHPFCAQCEREQENRVRERYAGIEREIVKQGNEVKWPKEDVEVALEVCRRECKTRLAGRRFKPTTSGDDEVVEDARISGNKRDNQEIIPHAGAIQGGLEHPDRDSNRGADDDQITENGRDDVNIVIDAYFDDNQDSGSVTNSIAGLHV